LRAHGVQRVIDVRSIPRSRHNPQFNRDVLSKKLRATKIGYGSEFSSQAMDLWAYQNGVRMAFSRPGKPTDNAFVESFNGTFRAECLDAHWFTSLTETQQIVETWRREYNESHTHRALGEKTPTEFANEIAAGRDLIGSPTAENSP
jgi:transposase InsO family protein